MKLKNYTGIKYNILRITALFAAVVLVLSGAGCSVGKRSDSVLTVNGDITEHFSKVDNATLHLIDAENLGNPMASSGLMQLYLDDNSLGVALFETSKEQFWYSLPTAANNKYDNSAAILTLDISCGNNLYHVNSQDNSVAWGNVACDVQGGTQLTGFNMRYVITIDKKTADKINKDKLADGLLSETDFDKTDIAFEVVVSYELKDGNLYIGANWKNLSGNTTAVIENLGVLEFFGASDTAEEGDFMLVPDGCGAVINTAAVDSKFEPLSFKVYGDGKDGTYPASFPAFGAKQGSNAFIIIIESGDAIATVSADRASGSTGFNTVGANFSITETDVVSRSGQQVKYINSESFTDEVRLCVRLLGGGSASYDGMAAACREQFMRNKLISTNTVVNEEYLPFNLNVIGAATGVSRLTKKVEAVKSLTTYEQAQDMLLRMKAKGINNINMRYSGALDGGINQNKVDGLEFSSALGGKRDFEDLLGYASAQGLNVFLDINLLTWNSDRYIASQTGSCITGDKSEMSIVNPFAGVMGPSKFGRHTLRLSKLEKVVVDVLTDAKSLDAVGFCIGDAGSVLYSDYSDGYTSRQVATDIISQNIAPLSTGRRLMIDTGNFYAIKEADIIANLPLTPKAGERDGFYEAVPFVQMIVHGTADYSGEAVNLSSNPKRAMLRCVEYGACPSYEWCYEDSDSSKDLRYFDDWLNDAVTFYQQANEALGDLRDTRITDNYETEQAGVFCTEYENGAAIYVNYTSKAVELNGMTVNAESFMKIN